MTEGDFEYLYACFDSAVVVNEAVGAFVMPVSVLSELLVVQVVLSLCQNFIRL